jgi:alpha-glutamyl/putrescinyl thymine pyrophosphorylase clade 1
MTVKGLGSFLCGQIIADLKNDRYLVGAPDWHTFSVIGPGSKKGLDILFNGGTTSVNYQPRLLELQDSLPEEIHRMEIHNQDLQNCLCEFSKYHRYLHNEEGRRRYYP